MPKSGDIVRTNLDHAWLYASTKFADKMSVDRTGTVEHVPMPCCDTGRGTMQVRWNSLDGSPNTDDANWLMWVHTDLITLEAD